MADDIATEKSGGTSDYFVTGCKVFIAIVIVLALIGLPIVIMVDPNPGREQRNLEKIQECFEMGGEAVVKQGREYLIYKECVLSSWPTTTLQGTAG